MNVQWDRHSNLHRLAFTLQLLSFTVDRMESLSLIRVVRIWGINNPIKILPWPIPNIRLTSTGHFILLTLERFPKNWRRIRLCFFELSPLSIEVPFTIVLASLSLLSKFSILYMDFPIWVLLNYSDKLRLFEFYAKNNCRARKKRETIDEALTSTSFVV